MANITENWSLTMSSVDATSTTVSQRTPPSLQNTGITTISYQDWLVLQNAPTIISLPVSPILGFYIRNLGSSTQTVAVSWIPTGGVLNSVITLYPNAFIAFLEASTGANAGFTTLQLTASANGVPVELKLLG